jgi:hypothetical protein
MADIDLIVGTVSVVVRRVSAGVPLVFSDVAVIWSAVDQATSYRVEVGDTSGAANVIRTTVAATDLTMTVRLVVGTYYVRVVTVGGPSDGVPTTEQTVVVP